VSAFLRNFRGVLFFAAMSVNTIFWFIPIIALALPKLLPIAPLRRLLSKVLMFCGDSWVAVNSWLFRHFASIDWQSTGTEKLSRNNWYLVVANHQTWVDIVVLQHIFNRRIPFLKFFIKQQLIWFPLLGLAWWALDMPFMKRHSPSYLAKHPEKKGKDLETTRKACEKFRDTPTSVINFIEGTRFSEHKRIARNSPYKHLLAPRAGGLAIAMSSMGELFDAILDVTLIYPQGAKKFWALCCGEHVKVRAEIRVLPVDPQLVAGDYQNDREFRRYMHRWLNDLWVEKDKRMDEMLAEQD